MKYVKAGGVVACVFSLVACSTTPTSALPINTVVSTPSLERSNTELSQIIEINGLKIAFPNQWAINPARGGGPSTASEKVWDIASSATAAANDEGGLGTIICPMSTVEGYDSSDDIHEQRSLVKGATTYDVKLDILSGNDIAPNPWRTSVLFSKKGTNLLTKDNSCNIIFLSDNPWKQSDKDLFKKIYQSIQ